MSFRTVVITKRCKLDFSLGYLEVRSQELQKIHISEIYMLIIESTGVSLTAALLCELMHRKVKVIFCDEKRNPSSELIPCYGSYDTSGKIRQQIAWPQSRKDLLWTAIIREKIRKQQAMLRYAHQEERSALLGAYAQDVREADASNREGHAAKVYFGGLFGPDFSRNQDCAINQALNFGYAILLSSFNREIVANGYITQLGIFHDNMLNPFNLACDLMEPYRPLVDRLVYDLRPTEMTPELKHRLIDIVNACVTIENSRQHIANAIKIYCKSVFRALNENDMEELRFYEDELSLYEGDRIF